MDEDLLGADCHAARGWGEGRGWGERWLRGGEERWLRGGEERGISSGEERGVRRPASQDGRLGVRLAYRPRPSGRLELLPRNDHNVCNVRNVRNVRTAHSRQVGEERLELLPRRGPPRPQRLVLLVAWARIRELELQVAVGEPTVSQVLRDAEQIDPEIAQRLPSDARVARGWRQGVLHVRDKAHRDSARACSLGTGVRAGRSRAQRMIVRAPVGRASGPCRCARA